MDIAIYYNVRDSVALGTYYPIYQTRWKVWVSGWVGDVRKILFGIGNWHMAAN